MSARLTTITLPGGRTGTIAAAGLTLLAAIALWVGVVGPLVGLYADRAAQLGYQRTLLARMTALNARLPELRAELAQAAGADRGRDSVLPGTRDASAGAALQQMVTSLASDHGLTLASITALRAEAAGDSRRIAVRVTMTARWVDLAAFLHALQDSRPILIADDLAIQAPPDGDLLDISLTVQGFRAGATPDGAAGEDTSDTPPSSPAE